MPDTIPNIVIQPDTITDIYADPSVIAAGVSVGDSFQISLLGQGDARAYFGTSQPVNIDNESGYTDISSRESLSVIDGCEGVFVYSLLGCVLNISLTGEVAPPTGLYTGTRAMTTQGYREANVKKGLEFEGSVLFNLASLGASNTIFLTGALPVSLKTRVINYSGEGVKAEIFEAPNYTGGSSVAYQNSSAYATPVVGSIPPAVGLVQILTGAVIVDDGTLKFAPVYGLGNTSNQGKGATNQSLGEEHILKANTAYLLRITSLDSAAQSVSSFLSWYEGELDLYPA